MRYKYKVILIISLISLAVSIFLSLTAIPPICTQGCDLVRTSKYSETFGINNSIYGIVIFAFLSILTLTYIKKPSIKKRVLIHLSVIIGALTAISLIYVQAIILKSYCKYCLVVDFAMLIALVAIFVEET